jgi:D-alanyl-D-alanine carboxypeptidase
MRAHGLIGVAGLVCAAGLQAATAPPSHLAAVVIDANNGRVLHAFNANRRLFPASLAKMMSAYLVLDALEAGTVRRDDLWSVSAQARGQPPTTARLRAGEKVTVETALLGMLVPSGNDAAVVSAEGVAGSEDAFAGRMNIAAARLGMAHSYFTNASGLPDPVQFTTARDLAVLARALWLRFPDARDLFSRRAFSHRGRQLPTTNGFLDSYPGARGMKTGFTCNAGYNLVAVAERDGRQLIGVVLGARNPEQRAATMRRLLDQAFRAGRRAAAGDLATLARSADQGAELPLPRSSVAELCVYGTGGPWQARADKPSGWNVEIGTTRTAAAAHERARDFIAQYRTHLHGGRALALPRPLGVSLHRILVTALTEDHARAACLAYREQGGECVIFGPDIARAQMQQLERIRKLQKLRRSGERS